MTELAFRRSGDGWWFADWMIVLTTGEVADVLSSELQPHGSPKRGQKTCLVRYDVANQTETWGSGRPRPSATSWLDFWDRLLRCGQADWPQLVRLPAHSLAAVRAWHRPEEVLRLLRAAARQEQRRPQDLVTLVPSDGGFLAATDEDHGLDEADWAGVADEGVEDHRQVVFLDAAALKGLA
ncbi:hypothetical protein [Kribbella kalugense]|uniref:hypothetical protein n=1 Tax=Kribbella kalugense TaxID=2512221 RepID=UPI0010671625|nr:hypothetical protein [Kribbella kalugense]